MDIDKEFLKLKGKFVQNSHFIYKRWGIYLLGLFLMSLGVAFSVISDLGVSPVSALPYAFSLITGIELGLSTIIIYTLFILLQAIILGKNVKLSLLLQIVCSFMFGYFTTFSLYLINALPTNVNYGLQLIYLLISVVLVALGLLLYIPANLFTLPYDGIVNALAMKTNKKFPTVKIICDVTIVAVSAALCLIFIFELGSVREGTLISAIGVGKVLTILMNCYSLRVSSFLNGHGIVSENSVAK